VGKNINNIILEDIVSMTLLKHKCDKCKMRADFCIEMSCKNLPKPYCTDGTRVVYFCRKHLPKQYRDFWNMPI
jgi:hypothetical protein